MRDLQKCFYGSSYDRGLEHLLKMWPDVKKAVPKASLEIAYGFQLFDQFYASNPASMMWKAKMEEMMKYDGITHHGRLPQPKVAKLMKECGIWTTPTHFGEINCINASKAQSFGCVPVIINYAALKETVQFGIKINGDVYDEEVKENYKKQLIWLLQNPDWQEKVRKPMMKWAENHFAWSRIARQWNEEFLGKPCMPFWEIPKGQLVKIIDGYSGQEITDKELALRNDKRLLDKDSIAL